MVFESLAIWGVWPICPTMPVFTYHDCDAVHLAKLLINTSCLRSINCFLRAFLWTDPPVDCFVCTFFLTMLLVVGGEGSNGGW